MLFRISALLFGVMTFGPTFAENNGSIAVNYQNNGQFEVLYHRVQDNVTGAVLFGLIGAGIDAGIRSDKDAQKNLNY